MGHLAEPARTVTTEWDTPHPIVDRSVTGWLDPDQRDDYGVEHHTDRSVSTRHPRKRQRSESSDPSYSERDDAEIEIQDLR
eukprot:2534042-Amphidinium_carterae.1